MVVFMSRSALAAAILSSSLAGQAWAMAPARLSSFPDSGPSEAAGPRRATPLQPRSAPGRTPLLVACRPCRFDPRAFVVPGAGGPTMCPVTRTRPLLNSQCR